MPLAYLNIYRYFVDLILPLPLAIPRVPGIFHRGKEDEQTGEGREGGVYIYILSMQHRRWLGMEGGEYIINAFTFSHSSNQNCESCWVTLYNNRDIIPRASDLSYLSFLSLSLSFHLHLHSFIPFTYPVASLSFSLHLPLFLHLFSPPFPVILFPFYCLCPPAI